MTGIRVREVKAYVLTFEDRKHKGWMISLPLYSHNGEWKTFGSYQAFGVSPSDPTYAAVHALPYKWKPPRRMIAALNRFNHKAVVNGGK